MSEFFHIDPRIEKAAQKALKLCRESFLKIEEITEYNQQKMLAAFAKAGVSESHFAASTGYGYGDRGGMLWTRFTQWRSKRRMRWCGTILSAGHML